MVAISSGKTTSNYCAVNRVVGAILIAYGSAASICFATGNTTQVNQQPTGQSLPIQSFDDLSIRFFGQGSVVFDAQCNVFFADRVSSTVRKIASGGEVFTIAGKAGERGDADGTGEAARFSAPIEITIDTDGNLYVIDGQAIRKVTQSGVVTTVAGSVRAAGDADGKGADARFQFPFGIVTDGEGNLFVADLGNDLVRKIAPDGTVSTVAGIRGGHVHADGPNTTAQFTGPFAVTFDRAGKLYVLDVSFPPSNFAPSNISYIRQIDSEGVVTSIVSSTSPLADLRSVGRLETMGSDRFGCTGRHIAF